MTSPDTSIAAAASPALGADPGRTSTSADEAPPADVVEVAAGFDGSEHQGAVVLAYTDADGRVHHATPESKNTRTNLASGAWVEGDVRAEDKDWTKANVADVVAHLNVHADDQAEVDRVQAAEAAARNRVGITSWTPSS